MMQFKGFKPEAAKRIAVKLGYGGDMSGFNTYLKNNPDKQKQMNMYTNKAIQMVQGGYVKNYSHGGFASYNDWVSRNTPANMGDMQADNWLAGGAREAYNKAKREYDNTQHSTNNNTSNNNTQTNTNTTDTGTTTDTAPTDLASDGLPYNYPNWQFDPYRSLKDSSGNLLNSAAVNTNTINTNTTDAGTTTTTDTGTAGTGTADTGTTTTDNVQTTTTANTTGTQTQSSSNTQGTPIPRR